MTRVRDLHEQWSNDPEYMEEYERLSTEFELAKAIIEARTKAGLTQEELADRMKTSQSAVARMESGKGLPSASTLKKLAQATGTHLKITFERSFKRKVKTI
jgi:transcriptional regulator with XRE-family HTH domain